jgi:hypothetical protein
MSERVSFTYIAQDLQHVSEFRSLLTELLSTTDHVAMWRTFRSLNFISERMRIVLERIIHPHPISSMHSLLKDSLNESEGCGIALSMEWKFLSELEWLLNSLKLT